MILSFLRRQESILEYSDLNMLIIGDESAAINKGLASFATQVPLDILNVSRTTNPDLGAYQHITFPEDD